MNKTALLIGGIPFYKPRKDTGRYLTPDSYRTPAGIKTAGGQAVVCWRHWFDDSYTFQNKAAWFVAGDGVAVMHNLDLSQPQEREVYELAKAGRLELSPGRRTTPEAQRAASARRATRGQPKRLEIPLNNEVIGHWAYCAEGAFPQSPVKVVIG